MKRGSRNERKGAQRGPSSSVGDTLSHDTFWIGANNLGRTPMRWVDGRTVDYPQTVFSTGNVPSPQRDLCGVLRLTNNLDDDFGKKLAVKRCNEPQRYPFICEIDSGSEIVEELEPPVFRDIFQE